jgi:hypothetical protein
MRELLKRIAIALIALLVVLLGVAGWIMWASSGRLERRLAAIHAAGDPVTLADLARKPIPPETNADTYLRRAEPGINAISTLLYPAPPASPIMEKLTGAVQNAASRPAGKTEIPLNQADLDAMSNGTDGGWEQSYGNWEIKDPRPAMPPRLRKSLQRIFAAHPEVIPLLERAANCPDYDAQLDYTLPPSKFVDIPQPGAKPAKSQSLLDAVQAMRSAARVLRCQSFLLLSEGKRDAAVRSALAIFRLSRHCGRNPTATSHLVAAALAGMAADCANTVLHAGPVSPETRTALDAELALQDGTNQFVSALKSERAFFLASFPDAVPGRNVVIARSYWNGQESDCLDVFDIFLAMAKSSTSWREAERRIDGLSAAKSSFLPREQISACRAYYQTTLRIRAMIRSLRVLNALQAQQATGEKMPKLAELGLPATATIDPFSGEPLHVKKTPRGWLVYSVGPNLRDDGGKVEDPTSGDVGVGPPPLPATKSDEPAKK